jgi:hypothetical protein
MLLDGVTLASGSEIQNSHVESGTSFPSPVTQGRMYYLSAASGNNAIGLYVYDGTTWVTGDITSVSVGNGLTGGGGSGSISLSIDTTVIATTTSLATHAADLSLHLTASQNTLLDALTVTAADINYTAGLSSNAQTQITSKVSKSGDTMTGNLVMSANQTVTVPTPTGGFSSSHAVNKTYVDSLVAGLTWLNPVLDVDLVDDSLVVPPSTPVTNGVYLIGATPSGSWAGLAGHAVYWSGTAWVDILGRAAAVGDRFGITMEYGAGYEGGNMTGHHNQIVQITTATPGAYAYTFTVAASGQAVFDNNAASQHFGHSYVYDSASTAWVEFSGPNATPAGVALSYSGNTLNVNLGAGVSQLPTDEVGVDLYSSSGLMLTTDGTTTSTNTNAQLAIQLDGSTIAKSANGIKVAPAGITATEIATSAIGADLTGGSGVAITLTTTGVTASTYKSVTVDGKGRITAGTNPTTLAGYGITDAAPVTVGYNAFVATASQTVFTFTGITNVVGSHRLMVFIGGNKQLETAYTETTTNITLSAGLTSGTPVEVYFR